MEERVKFMQAAGLAVDEQTPPEEQLWLRSMISDLGRLVGMSEQQKEEQEEAPQEKIEKPEAELDMEPYTITAPSYLSKGGLLDMAKVLSVLPSWMEIRVGLDLSEATGLTYIAAGVFTHCKALQSVKLPPSVIEIGHSAFEYCDNLESVTIPEGVTTIGDSAFSSCRNLASVDIPEGVTTIGNFAFSGCRNRESVTIPASVTTIGAYAFRSLLSSLESVTFQKTDGWCTEEAYNEPSEPIDVSDPKANAERLREGVWNSKGLIRRTEPYLKAMEEREKFMQAAGLAVDEHDPEERFWLLEQRFLQNLIEDLVRPVEMSEQLLELEEQLMKLEQEEAPQEEIDQLEEKMEELEADLDLEAGDPYSITAPSCLSKGGLSDIAKVLNALPSWMEIRVELDLSEATGLTYIPAGVFTHCKALLQSVKLPPSVIEIGHHAFDSFCGSLESVDIPEGVTTIGKSAFSGCTNLESVVIPASVTIIGDSAFEHCSNLKSVTFEGEGTWHLQDPKTGEIGEPIDVSDPKANAKKLREGDWIYNYLIRRTEP